jgi:AcrR family transcriptional regulator
MSEVVSRRYGGVSAAHRRDDRRARLMAAGLEIMGTRGVAATTVTGVCERARVGPRFFYEHFPNLETLLLAVLDDISATATERALAAVAAAADDPHAQARAGITTMIEGLTDDRRRARIMFAEAYGNEAMMKRRYALVRTLAELVVAMSPELNAVRDRPPHFADALALMMTGAVAEVVIVWVDGGLEVNRDELVNICVEMLLTVVGQAEAMAARLDPKHPAAVVTPTSPRPPERPLALVAGTTPPTARKRR